MTTRPSGSTATAPTPKSWRPSSTGPVPGSAGSHTSTRPFPTRPPKPPVTTRPSGSTATASTPPSSRPSSSGPVPGSAGSHTSTRRRRGRRSDHPPVRQRRHRPPPQSVAAELDRASARLRRVPHQHPAAAGDHPPVRQHRHRPHPEIVAAELKDQGRACPPRGPLEHRARVVGGKLPGPAVGGQEGFAEFGRLQAQLTRHEPGIAGRFPAAQVVGLAPHHGVHGRQPRFAGGGGASSFQFGQHRVDTEGPDGGGDPVGIAGQCGQPRRITV